MLLFIYTIREKYYSPYFDLSNRRNVTKLVLKEANRRLTTILMTDVVGYSRLMAVDKKARSRNSRRIEKS